MRAHRAGAGALLIALVLAGCGGGGAGSGGGRTDADVIRAWSDAVRERHYDTAADLFALPSTIENGVSVTARKRADVDIFNRSLSCGSKLLKTQPAAGDRVLATFRLVKGPGGACSGEAQVRFRIVKGHITEWIRADQAPPPDAQQT